MNSNKTIKAVLTAIIVALSLWICVFTIDWITVDKCDRSPVFCIQVHNNQHHYTGLGYTYDTYVHPISGQFEYSLKIFGFEIVSNFTD